MGFLRITAQSRRFSPLYSASSMLLPQLSPSLRPWLSVLRGCTHLCIGRSTSSADGALEHSQASSSFIYGENAIKPAIAAEQSCAPCAEHLRSAPSFANESISALLRSTRRS